MSCDISPFTLLLNRLSNHLDQRNLRSLIHICEDYISVPQRETINGGLEIFTILRHQNKIGEEREQMKFLLKIIREMRPKRKDLVEIVERYIKKYYDQPETILDDLPDDLQSSSEVDRFSRPRTPPPLPFVDPECCSVRCGCFNCNCNPCCGGCCCCVILAILCSFFAVIAALVWYSNLFPQGVQDYLRNHDLNRAGPVVISVLGLIAVCCVSCGVYLRVKRRKRKRNNQLAFVDLQSINEDRSTSNGGSYMALATICSAKGRNRSRDYSTSSGHITASNSVESTGTALGRSHAMPWRNLENAATADGSSQLDIFSTEFEEDLGSRSCMIDDGWNPGRGRDGGDTDQL